MEENQSLRTKVAGLNNKIDLLSKQIADLQKQLAAKNVRAAPTSQANDPIKYHLAPNRREFLDDSLLIGADIKEIAEALGGKPETVGGNNGTLVYTLTNYWRDGDNNYTVYTVVVSRGKIMSFSKDKEAAPIGNVRQPPPMPIQQPNH